MLSSHQEQFHLKITSGQIGRYCILPGDPGRCEKIAAYLEAPRQISQNREYNIFTGTLDGDKVINVVYAKDNYYTAVRLPRLPSKSWSIAAPIP